MNLLGTPKRWIPAAVVTAVVLGTAAPAFAHVSITSNDAQAGRSSTMTLSVPNEKDNAGTVEVDLVFPEGHTLTDVSVQDTPGWTATVNGDRIVWKGGPLTGEDRVELRFTATLPEGATTLEFRVLQVYDNGDTVRWIEATPPGGPEPDFPAPVLTVGAGASEDHHAEQGTDTTAAADDHAETTVTTATADDDHGEAAADDDTDDDSDNAVIAVIIIAVVAVAAAGGGVIYMRSRRAS